MDSAELVENQNFCENFMLYKSFFLDTKKKSKSYSYKTYDDGHNVLKLFDALPNFSFA